jgi:hypothetical protein
MSGGEGGGGSAGGGVDASNEGANRKIVDDWGWLISDCKARHHVS